MNVFTVETGAEITKALRAPEFILPTVLLPTIFYAIFGVMLPGSATNSVYLLATYGIFAVMGPSIFGFGVGVSNERERGWLQLKRASPAPSYVYIAAKLVTTLIFVTIALIPIYLIAGFFAEVELPRLTWISLYLVHLLAVFPFVLLGLSLGFSFGSAGAVAISNIVYLGLAILGGLWFPVFIFPELLQTIAAFTPSYHLGEIALAIVEAPGEHNTRFNTISISLITMLLIALTLITWRRQR